MASERECAWCRNPIHEDDQVVVREKRWFHENCYCPNCDSGIRQPVTDPDSPLFGCCQYCGAELEAEDMAERLRLADSVVEAARKAFWPGDKRDVGNLAEALLAYDAHRSKR